MASSAVSVQFDDDFETLRRSRAISVRLNDGIKTQSSSSAVPVQFHDEFERLRRSRAVSEQF